MSGSRGLLAAGLVFALAARVGADSWAPPAQFEAFSGNKRFVAVIDPGTSTNRAQATILRLSGRARSATWRVKLSNSTAPLSAYVTDDGLHLVTLNNWAGVGHGNDVVGVYDAHGQLAKYSLEEFAPPPGAGAKSWADALPTAFQTFRSRPKASKESGYGALFTHTAGSRWWNERSIQLFWPESNSTLFCLWVDWDNRWVAVSLADGRIIRPSKAQVTSWNGRGRQYALEKILAGSGTLPEYNFLGRMQIPEDRPVIKTSLGDPIFSTSYRWLSSIENGRTPLVLTAHSARRELADWLLERWDRNNDSEPSEREQYRYLGSVTGIVHLPRAPRTGEGVLRIQLAPPEAATWNASPLEHYLIGNLALPVLTNFQETQGVGTSPDVRFAILGVTPGSYRVQALWDSARPICDGAHRACEPTPGDFCAASFPLIRVRAGETSEQVHIDCKAPVE